MSALLVLVDYDNVDRTHRAAGPVNMAKMLVSIIPAGVVSGYGSVRVRLYGGWRTNAILTRGAQSLVPDIRANSPFLVPAPLGASASSNVRVTVELAESPLGGGSALECTLVDERGLRNFRSRTYPLPDCACQAACGLSAYIGNRHSTPCPVAGCNATLGDVFVRDEQKMVDTLIVADIAFQALSIGANDVVVVSSDTDMWPGVLLALSAGRSVTHIHTKRGWRTQRHLMNTLNVQLKRNYRQFSV